ncbi:MAG: TerC family protein [Polyangiaceae bacterium]
MWVGFLVFVLALLALDLGVFHRKAHDVSIKEAGVWSAVWIGLAAVFNVGVYHLFGSDRAIEFATGYLIEKALAVDNIFVFVILFSYFAVPTALQHRVLFWGILGALVMRAGFILAGGAFLQRYHFAIYVFGAILLVTGVKLLLAKNEEEDMSKNVFVRALRRVFPVTDGYRGDSFVVKVNGKRFITPLMLALLTVELTDVVFAIDSIPAIFAVTRDPFIVFTSNIFAILGLRSLYFLLAGVVKKFHYLKTGLAFILVFVGGKMVLTDLYKFPVLASLGVIAAILATSVVASIVKASRDDKARRADPRALPASQS